MDFGGTSHGHHAASHAVSSSTLSPLAPPFTVDRGGPRPSLPYDPYASSWSQGNPCSGSPLDLCPPSPLAPSHARAAYRSSGAADSVSYFGHGHNPAAPGFGRVSSGESSAPRGINLAHVEPYYPRFFSPAAASGGGTQSLDCDRRDGSPRGSGHLGRGVPLPSVPFDMGMEADGAGGTSLWAEAYEDLHGGWHGKDYEYMSGKDRINCEHLDLLGEEKNAGISSGLSGISPVSPSAPVEGCYPHSSGQATFSEGSKAYDSNSFANRYVAQVDTRKTDPITFHKVTPYFPGKISATIGNTTDASMSRCVQHGTYEESLEKTGHVLIRPKYAISNLNFQSKHEYSKVKKMEAMDTSDNTIANSPSVKITSPPSIESANQISKDCALDRNSEIRTADSKTLGAVESFDTEKVSSEIFDEHLAVDSPCWKGASSSQHPEFSTLDTGVANHAFSGRIFDNLLQRGSDYSITDNGGVAQFSCFPREVGNNISCSKDHRNCFVSQNKNAVQTLNEDICGSSGRELVTEIANQSTDPYPILGVPFGFRDLDTDQLSIASKTVADICDETVKSPSISDPSFMSPTLPIDAQLLVKTIHNLSGLLLTTCHSDANVLKEHDRELLQSVVNNLGICISKKIELGRTRPEPSCCSVSYSHKEFSSPSQDLPAGKFPSPASRYIDGSRDQGNNCPGQGEMHPRHYNVGSQFEEPRQGKMDDRGENSQPTTSENLWFEVEDAVHQLKHKLDALRSDLVMDRRQRHSRGGWGPSKLLGQSPRDPLVGESIPALRLRGVLLKSPSSSGNQGNEAKSLEPQPAISSGIDHITDDVDPSVMDRFRVLKGRIERLNLVDAEEPHGLPSSLVIENRGPSGGKVVSRVDFDSNSGVEPGNHPRVLGSWSGGHFVGFPYGSSDWEHVLKEELTW